MYAIPPNTQPTDKQTEQMCQDMQKNGLPVPAACAPYSRECQSALMRRYLTGSAIGLSAASAAAVATHSATKSTGWTIAAFIVTGSLANIAYRLATPGGEYPAVCEPATKQQ